MATGRQIEATYDYLDEVWRLSLGDRADITCAFFDGDYGKTLERAQADKHRYILDGVRFRPGMRVLDVGCGWGGLLDTVRRRGGTGVGLTLSPRQCDTLVRVCCHVKEAFLGTKPPDRLTVSVPGAGARLIFWWTVAQTFFRLFPHPGAEAESWAFA